MCNRSAAIQAEAGRNKIEEEDVHIIAEDLLPNAEMLLNINTQVKAKKYFSLDAWKTVESTLSVLEGNSSHACNALFSNLNVFFCIFALILIIGQKLLCCLRQKLEYIGITLSTNHDLKVQLLVNYLIV